MLHRNKSIVVSERRPMPATSSKTRAPRTTLLNFELLENRCLLSEILGTAQNFAALAGASVTNTGPTILNGDLGVSPGTAITGFPPGIVNAPGQTHQTDAAAAQAELDAFTAYNTLAALPSTQDLTSQDLGGLTLVAGVYKFSSSAQLTGTLTLDAKNNPNAMFVFQIGSTLTTASASKVQIINSPACFDNVFWQVGSSATLGSTTDFYGAVIALTSITMISGASITQGNALALNGSITLGDNIISPDQCGSISGIKFQDTNADGIRQSGEPGLPGVTIFLDGNGNGALDAGEISTLTDASGNYHFIDVAPGARTVREVVPSGWVQTTANPAPIIVPARTDAPGGDFGNRQVTLTTGQIVGVKFTDTNGDGIRQAGEPGLAGITLFLDADGNGTLDAGESSTLTDASGGYVFANLAPGVYTVREVVPAGSVRTTINPAAVQVASGATVAGGTFGNFTLGQIGGTKFQDTNGDGFRQAGEPGIAGVTLFIDTNGNYRLDAGEVTSITGAGGVYTFTGVGPGSFDIREAVPTGWTQTTPNPLPIVTISGGSVTAIDFGDAPVPTTTTITGTKFQDTNGDGIRETGEPGVQNVVLFLDINGNGILDNCERCTVSDANGRYTFTDVAPGTYSVRERVPAGWVRTTTNPGSLTVTTTGANLAGGDFGNFQLGKISGVKFQDSNGNGARESTEPGLAGFTVFMDANGNGTLDSGERTTLTTVGGGFVFYNVGPGAFTLREVVPSGWNQTTLNPAAVVMASGAARTGVVFGNQPASVRQVNGVKFLDANGDGIRQTGETGIGGVTLFLDANGNNKLDAGELKTITDAAGGYAFTNVLPGIYSVRELVPDGWVRTTANPNSVTVTATTGALAGGNFGNFQLGKISGVKFQDTNGNGVRDITEPGLSGFTIFIDANGNGRLDTGERTTLTNVGGGFVFYNVAPGAFTLREVVPSGWTQTTVNPAAVVMATGAARTSSVFGNKPATAKQISGIKFLDANGDGIRQTGEAGIGGVTLFLDANANNRLDSGELTTLTDAGGGYAFTNVPLGTFNVREVVPAGWLRTTPNPAPVKITTAGSTVAGGNFGDFQLGKITGVVSTQFCQCAGVANAPFGSVRINLFRDVNKNGIVDAADGAAIKTTITGSNGVYTFSDLTAGAYVVQEVIATGFTSVGPASFAFSIQSGSIVKAINLLQVDVD
ncbi:MAG: Cna B-type [Phycisphaerales bacterium]|nr:Cna B-type [Phycisphaerales bacterium]